MKLDSVSFLFDKSELILLLRLLECKNIRFPSREAEIDTEAALERLWEDQLVSGSWEALAVDQVVAFLLRAMDGATFCLYASGGGYAAIFRTALASIVLRKCGERWQVTPFQAFADARIFMLKSLRKLKIPCVLTVCNGGRTEILHFRTIKAAVEAAKELLPVEEKGAKEKWKP